MLNAMPTQAEWKEWLQHPCTKRLRHWAAVGRQEKMEMWASGEFSAAFDMEMAVKNAGATGACSIYKELIELDYDLIVTGASDEEPIGLDPSGAGSSS